MKKSYLIFAVAVIGTLTVAASPYRDLADRPIKAMSPEKIDALNTGKGAGYALVAELNGYPGPRHVLDMASELALTENQLSTTRDLFSRMQAEAIRLGKSIIIGERQLEELFRARKISEAEMFRLTEDIAKTESRLRATHLKYHLAMVNILSNEQVIAYDRLRGYHPAGGKHQPGTGHFHGPRDP